MECLQAVALEPGHHLAWLVDFCNECWRLKSVPKQWSQALVSLIYKKGDPSDCGNYRPICLLNSAYKVFAMILLKRLQKAGADDRIWCSQFGFRSRRGTADALHCARRAVERALADKGGSLHLMALDWQKAVVRSSSIRTSITSLLGNPRHIHRSTLLGAGVRPNF